MFKRCTTTATLVSSLIVCLSVAHRSVAFFVRFSLTQTATTSTIPWTCTRTSLLSSSTTSTVVVRQQQEQPNSTTTTTTTMSRSIAKVIPATRTNPSLNRLIGTVDMDGSGTDHPLPEVDPFILLDSGAITKNAMPPFGAHPHAGHSVVTILLQGKVSSWDSFSFPTTAASHQDDGILSSEINNNNNNNNNRNHIISAPASYWVDAGSGLFHNEVSVIANEDDPSQHVRLLQLWVGVQDVDRTRAPRLQYDESLPVEEIIGTKNDSGTTDDPSSTTGTAIVGRAIHYVGPTTKIQTLHPISVIHVTQRAGTTYRMPLEPTHGGFIVSIDGNGKFGTTIVSDTYTVLVLADVTDQEEDTKKNQEGGSGGSGNNTYIDIQTDPNTDAEYIVCVGEKHGEVWVKKLVANGAVIAATPEQAREIATKVEGMATRGKGEEGTFAPFGRYLE
jgi:redox-sensitive bicupin YhaK (pirin superfamily)